MVGIRNPSVANKESGIQSMESGIQSLESIIQYLEAGVQYWNPESNPWNPESNAWNPESKPWMIRNPIPGVHNSRLSWIPLQGAMLQLLSKSDKIRTLALEDCLSGLDCFLFCTVAFIAKMT